MAERAKPSMSTAPAELVERFGSILEGFPHAARRQMFGYPAAFVGGNLATSLFADTWVVRLPASEIEAAKAGGAGSFEPMPDRSMSGFVVVPAADVADDGAIRAWVERGIAFAASLPAKA